MMTFEVFLVLLFAVSVLTTLFVEGIKKFTMDFKYTPSPNILAGVVAILLSVFFSVAYCVFMETTLSAQLIIIFTALALLSWLCAMIGYDKVMQALMQIKGGGKYE